MNRLDGVDNSMGMIEAARQCAGFHQVLAPDRRGVLGRIGALVKRARFLTK